MLEQSLARYAAADVIVYVGCGERGNEMTDVLTEFPDLIDPRTGGPLMDRMVLIANTSNMPVAAREASIYVGVTVAEYFRDQGRSVAVLVDSTSRWAEALREISSRLEEMPGEEGYPTYLASRLAAFYERAGRVRCQGSPDREGSVTIVGAVSPPGGDYSEPVTQSTMRVTGALWALDSSLAHRRHYPAVNWHRSYSLYAETLAPWFAENVSRDWSVLRGRLQEVLQREAELQEVVQLVGPDALQERDRFTLEMARLLRDGYLQQSAFSDTDASCSPERQHGLLTLFFGFHDLGVAALERGVPLEKVLALPVRDELSRVKDVPEENLRGAVPAAPAADGGERVMSDATRLFDREYRGVRKVAGPLLFVERASDLPYNAIVRIRTPAGGTLTGQVIEVSEEMAVIQVFRETIGLDVVSTAVTLTDREARLGVSEDLVGRVFDGAGRPIDGGPPVVPAELLPITGAPINPISRDRPADTVQTGISAIDGFNTLVRGQKLPIFSGAGLPGNELAAQILRQARVRGEDSRFVVVFGAIGITHRERSFFLSEFERGGAGSRTVTFLNMADDPTIERLLTPRLALTAAEYLAFSLGYEVLVLLTDMTSYCEALREIGTAREEIPGRRGYPGYMYTDLASLYERAGRIRDRRGSVTLLPILTMPDDDITHPIPDLTGYITEGQIVLSRSLHRQGVFPPIDVLRSLSRLMNNGIGEGSTREDHRPLVNQLYASFAEGQDIRRLLSIVGEEALSELDRTYLRFAELFERELINQGMNNRSIEETLNIGWRVLSVIPESEYRRINKELVSRYFTELMEGGVKTPFY